MPHLIPAGLTYNGWPDTFVVNNSPPIPLIDTDVTFVDDSTPNIVMRLPLTGPTGTAENYVSIGHSFLALIAAFLGGLFSRHLHAGNRSPVSEPVNPQV